MLRSPAKELTSGGALKMKQMTRRQGLPDVGHGFNNPLPLDRGYHSGSRLSDLGFRIQSFEFRAEIKTRHPANVEYSRCGA